MAAEGLSAEERSVFEKYKTKTIDELKDFLRWNNQMLSGTKVSPALPSTPPVLAMCDI